MIGDRWALRGQALGKWGKLPLVLAIACALLLALGISLAAAGKGIESWFGQLGTGDGQFQVPRDVAVYNGTTLNAGTDDIYVVDDNSHRVQRFDSEPPYAFEAQFGGQGGGGGQFDNPQGIAINQATGAVYVRDRDNRRVQQFNADGTFVRAWGWDVVASGPGNDVVAPVNEFEICVPANGDTCKTGASGAGGGQFATPPSTSFGGGIAVAPATGDVFVGDPFNRRVQQFQSNGAFVRLWGWDVVPTSQAGDLGTNNFEVCTSTATGACKAGVTATPNTSNGQFGANQPLHLAVDSEGIVYASDTTSSSRVMRFDSTQAAAQDLLGTPIGVPPLGTGATNAMEVDPSTDHVLISRGFANVLEVDTTQLRVVDTHLTGTTITPTGIGIDTSDDEILVASFSGFQGTPQHRVYVLDEPPTEAVLDPVTDITANSAVFHGMVDPNDGTDDPGGATTVRFEYTSDPVSDPDPDWQRAPAGSDIDVGQGVDPVPVSVEVGPLETGTEYRVRLLAQRGLPLGGSTTTGEQVFTTAAARPTIASSGATPRITTATLRGRINPQGQATTYRFEYGLTTGYGNAVPVPDGTASSSRTVQSVEESVSGLDPNTTYHFRLVAANPTGETQGPDGTFTTLPASGLPARAYEKVSPEDKNGGDTQAASGHTGFASPSGDEVVYTASQPFDDADGTAIVGSVYRARRHPTAWLSTPVLPPKEPSPGTDEPNVYFVSEDLSRAVVTTNAVLDTGAAAEECNAYVRDLEAGTYEFIAHADPAISSGCQRSPNNIVATDASTDVSTVLIETTGELTPDAADVPRDGPVLQPKLYLWRDGRLELASVAAGGPAAGTPTMGSAGGDIVDELLDNSISDDGSVVFFTGWDIVGNPPPRTPGGNQTLYRRSGGKTVTVGAEENSRLDPCGPPGGVCVGDGSTAPQFGAASADGSRVFFTSRDPLVDEDVNALGPDLYMYTHTAVPENDDNLTLISRDLEPGPPDGADVLGVLGASDDGSRVYFTAENQIVPGEDAAPADIRFYVWDEDEGVRHIGGGLSNPTFRDADAEVADTLQRTRAMRGVSANGRSVLFLSSIPLTDDDNGGRQQAYLYDFAAGQLVCASCPGASSLGEPGRATTLRGRSASIILGNPGPRLLSDDGVHAFFETDSRLVPEDTNGLVDVYAWEGGAPRLISSGQSADRSLFIDASANGDEVFFGTRERLVPWDEDNLRDTYVARVGGGLPDPRPSTGTPCEGDECQGSPAGAPLLMDPVSDLFSGFGDLALRPRPSFALRRLSKAQLAKLARGGRVLLPVRVSRAGRVSLTARAKMGKRRRVIARSSKRATRAGTVGVPLQLSKASRRQLARKGRLRASVSVRFAGVREPRGMTLRLRRAGGRS